MNAISRRDFLLGGALGSAGLVVGAAAPAEAAHITEPHEPVIGIGLNLWNYPDGTPTRSLTGS